MGNRTSDCWLVQGSPPWLAGSSASPHFANSSVHAEHICGSRYVVKLYFGSCRIRFIPAFPRLLAMSVLNSFGFLVSSSHPLSSNRLIPTKSLVWLVGEFLACPCLCSSSTFLGLAQAKCQVKAHVAHQGRTGTKVAIEPRQPRGPACSKTSRIDIQCHLV